MGEITTTARVAAPLDPTFQPLAVEVRRFRADVAAAGGVPLAVAVERGAGDLSRCDTAIFPSGHPQAARNYPYVERLVKTLLWARGGWRVYIGGAPDLAAALAAAYAPGGARAFDADIMGRIYENTFTVVGCAVDAVPAAQEPTRQVGGHLAGCRIGFDAGASDRKVAAVVDGEEIFSEEVVWDPKVQANPGYHYHEIMSALHHAAARMPRVDAIGVSSAGVYVNNRVRAASLFRGVPQDQFDAKIKPLFLDIQSAWGVPLEVVNDGDVTALAGAMSLEENAVIGVAMGSSEAGGYVNPDGRLTSWLNELAFVPIDVQSGAPADEWSGDVGCGVQYLSQQAVARLIPVAGLPIDTTLGQPEQLKAVQALADAGDPRVTPLYETIGVYLGYALAYYAEFYDFRHALVLGRVTSGPGGPILLERAQAVLATECPDLAARVTVHLPNEKLRRVGQAIAAASLPEA
jgi:predicted NBD/HSP70 family sugar kinase